MHNSGDDGIEIFGGRVNLKHVIVTGAFDANLDGDTTDPGEIKNEYDTGEYVTVRERLRGELTAWLAKYQS